MAQPARTAVIDNDGASFQRRDTRLLRILGMSRYAVGIAVVGTFLAATALLFDGAVEVFQLVDALVGADNSHGVARFTSSPLLSGISAVKTFLVAIVLYVIAIGFYQLFFHRLPLPA